MCLWSSTTTPTSTAFIPSWGLPPADTFVATGRKLGAKLSALSLLVVSAFGWLVTVSRGSTLGLVTGIVVMAAYAAKASRAHQHNFPLVWARRMYVIISCGCVICSGMFFSLIPWKGLVLLRSSSSAPATKCRTLPAGRPMIRGLVNIAGHPLFGLSMEENSRELIPPHQVNLYYAVANGLPVGVCSTVMLLCTFIGAFTAPT